VSRERGFLGWLQSKNPDRQASGPASSAGGPVYDASYQPADAVELSVAGDRLQQQRDLHLFGDKSAAASAFSNVYESQPSPTVVAMMGLAAQRDQIAIMEARRWELPFPGVQLGNIPSFSASPSTTPVLRGTQHLTHHAHQFESLRSSRARFNR